MDWKFQARAWLQQAGTVPAGEVTRRMAEFATDHAKVPLGTFRTYVAAIRTLDELTMVVHAFKKPNASAIRQQLARLSAMDLSRLRRIQRHNPASLETVLIEVGGGLRGDALQAVWQDLRQSEAGGPSANPSNSHSAKVRNRLDRSQVLAAAAQLIKSLFEDYHEFSHSGVLAPFTADGILLEPGRPKACISLRFQGVIQQPGLDARVADAFTSALAAARGFAAVYIVAQDEGVISAICKRLSAIGPCGVGLISVSTGGNRAFIEHEGRRRKPRRSPDLNRALRRLLVEKGLMR